LGTLLVASGASAFNQVYERDLDALMDRTRERPVADGRMSVGQANTLAAGFTIAGLVLLWLGANAAAALVAFATLLCYMAIYTPLKRRTSLATIVGAVPGALPPIIGWAAARGTVDVVAWSLFLIMFVWQLPHFLAIAWMYRDDYAKAGLPILTVLDTDGRMTGMQMTLWAATLVPASVLPFVVHLTSRTYAVGAIVLGVALAGLALNFLWSRTRANARWLFLGSITYLPLLWLLMAIGRP
jgi:protoheme IX farnesyltransferase